jgi:uncharacterized protein YwqG
MGEGGICAPRDDIDGMGAKVYQKWHVFIDLGTVVTVFREKDNRMENTWYFICLFVDLVMGFWQKLFNSLKVDSKRTKDVYDEVPDGLKDIQVAPALKLPMDLAENLPNIQDKMLETIIISPSPTEKPGLRESTFGYYPCLPLGYEYPRDCEGNYMYPLAQLNLGEMPKLPGYPESGYLQFYLAATNSYGLSKNDGKPSDFAVLFFDEAELEEIETDFKFLGDILQTEYAPVKCPHKLSFELKIEYFSLTDHRTATYIAAAMEKFVLKQPRYACALEDFFNDYFQSSDHKLGGYACFTQRDPRTDDEMIRNYSFTFSDEQFYRRED